jgi:hypothetical protein
MMAGDWIKMRTDLLTCPKVVRMASALNADRFRIVGGLLSVWCLFDAHSVDGFLCGYTLAALDDLAAWPGFSAAMKAVGWLEENDESLVLPRFEAHNGASAKRRAQDADRKKNVRNMSACDADKKRTREEKRREEYKSLHPEDVVDAPASTPPDHAEESQAEQRDRIPYEQIRDLYNQILGGKLKRCLGVTATHRKHLNAAYNLRLDGKFPIRDGGLQFWEGLFNDVLDCPFMLGANDRGWRADFEFLTMASKIQRFLEGKYDAT